VAEADRSSESVLTASFDLEQVRAQRHAWGVFRDRRPELYGHPDARRRRRPLDVGDWMTKPPATALDAAALRGPVACIDLETTAARRCITASSRSGSCCSTAGRSSRHGAASSIPASAFRRPSSIFTGISNDMVEDAPTFHDLRAEVRRRLDGRLFVAHNARFDYGFVRNEFRRAGEKFSAPVLCTVRLSRALFREHARHNLDTLIERYGLECDQRHRALGDAAVLPPLLAPSSKRSARAPARGATLAMNDSRLPPHLPPDLATTCRGPGVYLFRGEGGVLLYVGKSATCAAACSTTSRANTARARSRSSRGRCVPSNGSRRAASWARCCSSRGWSRSSRRARTGGCASRPTELPAAARSRR